MPKQETPLMAPEAYTASLKISIALSQAVRDAIPQSSFPEEKKHENPLKTIEYPQKKPNLLTM